MNIKQRLIGSWLGDTLSRFRDIYNLIYCVFKEPEFVGALANDQIALQLTTKICQPGHTFIDVGAHIGSVTSDVLKFIPNVRVEAIEAMPDKISNLVKNFPSVNFHACAVGERECEATFFINTVASGYSSLNKIYGANGAIKEIKVPVKLLDSLVQCSKVDVIKIDVEGAELGVLRGSINILNNCRPLVMFESCSTETNALGYSPQGMWEFLNSTSYMIVIPTRLAHIDNGLTKEGFVESNLHPRRTTNYFAVPFERRAEFRNSARRILGLD